MKRKCTPFGFILWKVSSFHFLGNYFIFAFLFIKKKGGLGGKWFVIVLWNWILIIWKLRRILNNTSKLWSKQIEVWLSVAFGHHAPSLSLALSGWYHRVALWIIIIIIMIKRDWIVCPLSSHQFLVKEAKAKVSIIYSFPLRFWTTFKCSVSSEEPKLILKEITMF